MKEKLNSVLLIDDDDATNFLNRKVLTKLGIADKVHTVLNGREALDFLSKEDTNPGKAFTFPKPQLILLDINMPVMDGWEFLDAYEKLEEDKRGEIVIVMLTTSFNPEDKERAKAISMISDFKNKPLDKDIIDDILKKHFPNLL